MCDFTIRIDVNWVDNSTWGMNPHAEVEAMLGDVRYDKTYGSASGTGYDKESAAVDEAFCSNPLLQTLCLWDGFVSVDERGEQLYGLNKNDYGYSFRFDACGMSVLDTILRANGFKRLRDVHSKRFDSYTYCRDMPKSFVELV